MPTRIISSKFIISSPNLALCPDTEMPEYAFIGRSNVGKSSLINALCEKKELARTSPKPGKTQLINYFEIESRDDENKNQTWNLVDLPGYGYAKVAKDVRKEWEHIIEHYMVKRKNLAHVFVLVDGRHTPQKSDLDFAYGLHSFHIPFSLVFTKIDKVSQKELSANIKLFTQELHKLIGITPPHFTTSAEKK